MRLIRQAGFAQHLIQDVLVLLRLEAPLSDESARLVGELAAFLGIQEEALAMRACNVVDILGLDVLDEDDEDYEDQSRALLVEFWPNRLAQALTAKALRAGLQGGIWLLEDDLEVDFPWQAKDAIFIFRNGAKLDTLLEDGSITLTDCRLLDAVLNFEGTGNVSLKRCDWQGDYDLEEKFTALYLECAMLTVTDCQFATRNARAIMVNGNDLTLTGSRFTDCGHSKVYGGAVWHSDHKRQISNCYFKDCLAALGGALYFNELRNIQKCEFIACQSLALRDKQAGDVGVYAKRSAFETVVSNCIFRKTSLVINSLDIGSLGNMLSFAFRHFNESNATFVRSTEFYKGNIYYFNKGEGDKISDKFKFVDGQEIEKILAS